MVYVWIFEYLDASSSRYGAFNGMAHTEIEIAVLICLIIGLHIWGLTVCGYLFLNLLTM